MVVESWGGVDMDELYSVIQKHGIIESQFDDDTINHLPNNIERVAIALSGLDRSIREALWMIEPHVSIGYHCYLILAAKEKASCRYAYSGEQNIEPLVLLNDFGAEFCIRLASGSCLSAFMKLNFNQLLIVALSYAAVDWEYLSGTINERTRSKADKQILELLNAKNFGI